MLKSRKNFNASFENLDIPFSDKTAPYRRCLELITPTEVTAINVEAPPDSSCKNTIWEILEFEF